MSEYNDAGFIINGQRQINAAQNRIIIAKIESQTILKDRIALLEERNSYLPVAGTHMRQKDAETIKALEVNAQANVRRRQQAEEELEESVKRIQQAEEEVLYYKDLLSKPMHEIANNNENFKNTYAIQQELLADWMVSQRAFKELAIDFGIKVGMKREDIVERGMKNKEKVLSNETEHGNNAEDNPFINSYTKKLKDKLK